MNKLVTFLLIPLAFVFFGCSTSMYKPSDRPIRLENGATQVKIDLNDSTKAIEGSSVGAYAKNCLQKVNSKGYERTSCSLSYLGTGKITKVENKSSLVEFDSSVKIDDSTEFEIK